MKNKISIIFLLIFLSGMSLTFADDAKCMEAKEALIESHVEFAKNCIINNKCKKIKKKD